MIAAACIYCHVPHTTDADEDGYVHCHACDGWYKLVQPDPLPKPEPKAPPPPPPLPPPPRIEPASLPDDLVSLGFKLIEYKDYSLAAVSVGWGCSKRSHDLAEVIRTARNISAFVRWVRQKQQEEQKGIDNAQPL